MHTGIKPLDILLERGFQFFLFDFNRYLVAALLVSAIVWGMRRTTLASRRIQQREATWNDRRREFLQSIQSVMVYAVVGAFVMWGVESGVLHRFERADSWLQYLGLTAAMVLAHDTYFYWAHRAMHHRKLFRVFHRAHHRSITPTPWAAYSFAIPEALVMALFVPLWLAIVPTPGSVVLTWLLFQITRNAMGHAGFELHPRWWLSTPLTRWINTTTHHDLHHSGGFNTNYGLYFTWWDKLMGTEHPKYAETFAKVTGGQGTSEAAPAEPITA